MSCIEQAQEQDAPILAELVNYHASRNVMLYRDEQSILDSLDRWVVAVSYADPFTKSGRRVIGGASLMHLTAELAELRSLVIAADSQGQGLGQSFGPRKSPRRAGSLGISSLCALTLVPGFFTQLDFRRVSMENISPKVWVDCVHCPKNQCCDEYAMIMDLVPNPIVRDYSHLQVKLPVRAEKRPEVSAVVLEDAPDNPHSQ